MNTEQGILTDLELLLTDLPLPVVEATDWRYVAYGCGELDLPCPSVAFAHDLIDTISASRGFPWVTIALPDGGGGHGRWAQCLGEPDAMTVQVSPGDSVVFIVGNPDGSTRPVQLPGNPGCVETVQHREVLTSADAHRVMIRWLRTGTMADGYRPRRLDY